MPYVELERRRRIKPTEVLMELVLTLGEVGDTSRAEAGLFAGDVVELRPKSRRLEHQRHLPQITT
jgi:hypothetical protein